MHGLKTYPQNKKPPIGQKIPITWVLVADAREAIVYTRPLNTEGDGFARNAHGSHMLVPALPVMRATPVTRVTGRHELGRVFDSVGMGRHMVEPSVDIKQETRRRFTHAVARAIEEAWTGQEFDRLVLVAAPRVLGDLRQALSPEVKSAVIAELHKSLTHCPLEALSIYLNERGIA